MRGYRAPLGGADGPHNFDGHEEEDPEDAPRRLAS